MNATWRWGSRIDHKLLKNNVQHDENVTTGKQSLTFVLTVEGPVTASAADGVGLGVAFTGHVE